MVALRRWCRVVPLAVMAAVSGILAGCTPARPAPDVRYVLLDGRPHTLAELRGHVVLVNFWSTDCAPCVAEMPALAQAWQRLSPRGFDTLAVSMAWDPPFAVSNFAQSRALPFGVAIDNTGAIADGFGGIRVTPTSFLIDRQGRVVRRWEGPTDVPALEAEVRTLLERR